MTKQRVRRVNTAVESPHRERLPVLMFTPLPPMRTGIGDYSYEVLSKLSSEFDITVVAEDGTGPLRTPPRVRLMYSVEYRNRWNEFADSLHLYQIGNNPDHRYMLPFMQRRPGVVVLHDPVLHHLYDLMTIGLGDLNGYITALETDFAEPGRILGKQHIRYGLRETRMHYELPMTRTVAASSLGVIVHSKYAAAKVLTQAPEAQVTVVPHQFSHQGEVSDLERSRKRSELGVEDGEVLFVSLGFATRSKQLDAALRALAIAKGQLPPFRYLIAGEIDPQEIDLFAMAKNLGLEDKLIAPGFVEESEFFSLIQASDVVINLRHPVGGETSGTMIRALGCGACIVVVDRGPFAEIPDGAATKLEWGPRFDQRLADALRELAQSSELRLRIGAAAKAYIAANNGIDQTVAGYSKAICAAQSYHGVPWTSTALWQSLPPARILELSSAKKRSDSVPLWFTAGLVPVSINPTSTLLISDRKDDAELLRQIVNSTVEVRGIIEFHQDPAGPMRRRCFDLIVATMESAPADSRGLLRRFNELLGFGGMLVFELCHDGNGADNTLVHRKAGEIFLRAAGFKICASEAGLPLEVQLAEDIKPLLHKGDRRCWLAVKYSEFEALSEHFTALASPLS